MSNSDSKSQSDGIESSAQCHFCKDEGLDENAVAFCASCWKYLCTACAKWHGKFLSDHRLKNGANMPKKVAVTSTFPCKIHTNYDVDMYREVHGSAFCSLCKPLKHDSCKVQKIEDVLKGMNVKQEFDTVHASLTELALIMAKEEDETRNKLVNYMKAKAVVETKMNHLKKELVEILKSYKTILEDQQQSDMESLHAKMESYRCLHQNLDDYMKPAKDTKIENDLHLFLSLVELKQQYKTYSEFHETLQKDMDDIGSFTLKDEQLPGLVQELSDISCLEYVADGQQTVDDGEGNFRRDQGCQIDPTMFDDSEATKQGQACSIDKDDIKNLADIQTSENDDVECGSSEEMNEKSFIKIKSFSFVKETAFSDMHTGDCCFLPDGQAVLCETSYKKSLIFLDKDLNVTLELRQQKSDFAPKHVAAVDSNTIVVSISKAKRLQFISVMMPEVSFGQEIALSCECNAISCFKNSLYLYSRCLDESAFFKYEGFQILSLKGQMLKTIPVFDNIDRFCITKSSNILYCGNRPIRNSKQSFSVKYVTKGGVIRFQCQVDGGLPSAIASDHDGIVIAFEQSTKCVLVVAKDGTRKEVLKFSSEPSAVCYSEKNDTLLVALYEGSGYSKVQLYKLEFIN